MRGRLLVACVAGLAILVLGGCMRQSAYYYIQPDDTVDGTIYIALDEAYVNASDPYRGTGADNIAASFAHSTITPFDSGTWKGYHVDFENEPVASFSAAVEDTWDVQILQDDNNEYVIRGYEPTSGDDTMRQAMINGDGFMQLTVIFPGTLISQTGAKEFSAPAEKPGWAAWDQLTSANAPAARGNGGLIFHLIPDIGQIFLPGGDPDPHPSASVAPSAVPDPVVTAVITPSPGDTSSASMSPGASLSPSPTISAVAAPVGESDSNIPLWVWIVGAILLAALAGLGGLLVATAKSQKVTPPPVTSPDGPAAVPPTAKASRTPKTKPETPEPED